MTIKEALLQDATLLVPGVGRRYKSTVIAELRNNPELSTDRLRRVRGAGTSMESEKAGDSGSTDSNESVGLFDDCVFYDPTCTGKFILGRVQRMRKKGTKGFIEYVRPVDISNKPANVEVIASKYCRTSEDSHLYYHQETVVAMPLTSLICKVHLEIIKTKKEKMTFMRYLRRIHVSSPNFFKVWKHSKGHPRLLVKEMLDPWLLTWKMMAEGWILSLHQVEDLVEEFPS